MGAARRATKKVHNEDHVLIEDVEENPTGSISAITQIVQDGAMKMLMAPPPEIEETHLHLQSLLRCSQLRSLLRCFQQEVLKAQDVDVKMLARAFALPEPLHAPSSISPVDPQVEVSLNGNLSVQSASSCSSETEASAVDLEAEVVTLCEQCTLALRKFRSEVALYEQEMETDVLIQEEQCQQEDADLEVERLVKEELDMAPMTPKCDKFEEVKKHFAPRGLDDKMPSTITTWAAGSPASAARRMRRSTPSLFRMDRDDRADDHVSATSLTQGYAFGRRDAKETAWVSRHGSAMSLDLGLEYATSTPRLSQSSVRSHKSARAFSMGAVKVTKSRVSVETLRPLATSKSSTILTSLSLLKAGSDSHPWSVRHINHPLA